MNSSNGPKPVFDFTKVSRQWDLAFGKTLGKSAKAAFALQTPMPDGADQKTQIEYFERMERAISDIENVAEEQASLVSQVLVSVPSDWLLADGLGKEIDWSKPESLNYVQSERYGDLLKMLQTGEARLQAKN